MKYCAYPFLMEEGNLCDYEVETDAFTSEIGKTMHFVQAIDQKDLLKLMQLAYHSNGSIRGKNAIDDQVFLYLDTLYEKYEIEMKQFVLPCGSVGACYLHCLRSKCKKIVRILYRIKQSQKEVPNALFDFWNFLSNLFFMMALYENQQLQIKEIPFVSKSYES